MEATSSNFKIIKSLGSAKYRRETGLFKIEGTKAVTDTVGTFAVEAVFATDAWIARHSINLPVTTVKTRDLERMSSLSTPPEVIAVCHIPAPAPLSMATAAEGNLVLALDTIQDPGNLGTIIRSADWFGVREIFCSAGTADAFSPKVVQATMGALSRVTVRYVDLQAEMAAAESCGIPVYGTVLDGSSIYRASLGQRGVVVIGNEGRGISPEVRKHISHPLLIPSYPPGEPTSESLNAATATAVTLAIFRGRATIS